MMQQRRGGIGMSLIISIFLHGLLLLYLPINWLQDVELRVYILDQYGPVQASIREEPPPEELRAQTPSRSTTPSQSVQVAKEVEPKVEPKKTTSTPEVKPPAPPKEEKKEVTSPPPQAAAKVQETVQPPKPIEPPKPPEPVKEPAKPLTEEVVSKKETVVSTSLVEGKGGEEVVTTSNPAAPVKIPVSPGKETLPSVPSEPQNAAGTSEKSSMKEGEGAPSSGGGAAQAVKEEMVAATAVKEPQDAKATAAAESPKELRIPGDQLVIGKITPAYPKYAQSDRLEGRVSLEIRVKTDGSIDRVTVLRSSGYSQLDDIARRTISDNWEFRGYGKAYTVPVTVDFRLEPSAAVDVKIGEVIIKLVE